MRQKSVTANFLSSKINILLKQNQPSLKKQSNFYKQDLVIGLANLLRLASLKVISFITVVFI